MNGIANREKFLAWWAAARKTMLAAGLTERDIRRYLPAAAREAAWARGERIGLGVRVVLDALLPRWASALLRIL